MELRFLHGDFGNIKYKLQYRDEWDGKQAPTEWIDVPVKEQETASYCPCGEEMVDGKCPLSDDPNDGIAIDDGSGGRSSDGLPFPPAYPMFSASDKKVTTLAERLRNNFYQHLFDWKAHKHKEGGCRIADEARNWAEEIIESINTSPNNVTMTVYQFKDILLAKIRDKNS